MRRLVSIAVLAIGLIGPVQAGFDAGDADCSNGVMPVPDRLAQSTPIITVQMGVDTNQDTLDFTSYVEADGKVTLTTSCIPVPVAVNGAFRRCQQVPPVERSSLLLVAKASSHLLMARLLARDGLSPEEIGSRQPLVSYRDDLAVIEVRLDELTPVLLEHVKAIGMWVTSASFRWARIDGLLLHRRP